MYQSLFKKISKKIFILAIILVIGIAPKIHAETIPPSVPTNVHVANITSSSAQLIWNSSTDTGGSGMKEYEIKYTGGHYWTVSSSPMALSPLTPGDQEFWVIAVDNDGNKSAASAHVKFTIPAPAGDSTPPTAPTNVHVTANTTGKSVTIAWNSSTDNVGVVGYSVQKCISCAPVTGSNKTVTSFTIGAGNAWNPYLTPLTAYTYYVTAYDAAGNISGYVTPASAVTFQTPAEAPGTNPGGGAPGTNPGTGTDTGGGYNFNVKFINPLGPDGPQDIPTLLNKILDALMLFLVPIVVLFIIYAGFLFVMAQGNDVKLTKAKSVLGWTLVGAAILLGAKIITTVLSSTVTNILK